MDGQHRDSQLSSLPDRVLNGIGDVVELEVEEDTMPGSDDFPDQLRPIGCECLEADLESSCNAAEVVGQRMDLGG